MNNSIDKLIEIYSRDLHNVILHAKSTGKTIYICGNGGSACLSDHYAQDLVGKGYRAISLCMSGSITAIANDHGFDDVFYHQIKVLGNKSDFLITMSCSGKSSNILKAKLQAKKMGLEVFSLPTNKETKLPTAHTQDIHLKIFHKVYQTL